MSVASSIYTASPEYADTARFNLMSWQNDGLYVSDPTGEVCFNSIDELEAFKKSDVTVADFLDERERAAVVKALRFRLPAGELGNGVAKAVDAVLSRLQLYSRETVANTGTSDEERYELMRSERDVKFAFSGIIKALDINAGDDEQAHHESDGDYFLDTHAWYVKGTRGRNSGYNAEYVVCNDTYHPDDEDHSDILYELKKEAELIDGVDLWPDEFHHPAKLEIRIDPTKRIEFIYTPEIETARQRHYSHSEVVRNGNTKYYDSSSLSIRIDIDPTAPHGIALDVGRSAYEGSKMTRSADLVGSVLSRTSQTGSHEYTGFTEGMDAEFRIFAEQLSVQLNLQHKEHEAAIRRSQLLAQSGLKRVSEVA